MNHPKANTSLTFFRHFRLFTNLVVLFLFLFFSGCTSIAKNGNSSAIPKEYIVVKIYHAADATQLTTIDQYLQASLLPSLQKEGFNRVGVFNAIGNDTAADKKIVVLVPFRNLTQLETLTTISDKSLIDTVVAAGYVRAAYNKPGFTRLETVLLRSFAAMPQVKEPKLNGNRNEQVYELRSYESATEALHLNKVQMFNEGEVQLFDRLGFNAIFYGQVMAGSRMPNLMYMTSFENKAVRDEHWKKFGSDPEWKTMSAQPQYQNNVSKIDITFLRPAAYSKL